MSLWGYLQKNRSRYLNSCYEKYSKYEEVFGDRGREEATVDGHRGGEEGSCKENGESGGEDAGSEKEEELATRMNPDHLQFWYAFYLPHAHPLYSRRGRRRAESVAALLDDFKLTSP